MLASRFLMSRAMRLPPLLAVMLLGGTLVTCARPLLAGGTPVLVKTWGSLGSGPGQFDHPAEVATDASDFVYVADQYNNRIEKFTADGAFVLAWGQYGTAPGSLYHPTGLAIGTNGEVYVVEHQNHRVSRFSRVGDFLGTFGSPGQGPGQFFYPIRIAADADGNVY